MGTKTDDRDIWAQYVNKPGECTLTPGAFSGEPLKQGFITPQHIAAANEVAARLHTTTANLLALGALESTWGTSPFAREGNNFFGLHYPVKDGGPPIPGHEVQMSSFKSFKDSLDGFADTYGKYVEGITNAKAFFKALQDSPARFGYNKDGTKVQDYDQRGAGTAVGIAEGLTCQNQRARRL